MQQLTTARAPSVQFSIECWLVNVNEIHGIDS